MSNFTPLISILVPVYNKANYIKESINSLLEQSYPNVEILIYDDFSTDESLSIIKDIDDKRIFIHTGTENKGVRYGRDYLLNKANGRIKTHILASTGWYKCPNFTFLNDTSLEKSKKVHL